MGEQEPTKRTVLAAELPEVRLKEVVAAVSEAFLKRDGGAKLKAVDPDGTTLEQALDKAVQDALSISPLEALLKAWKGLAQVADLIGAKGPMDGKPRDVVIAGHTLKAGFTPKVVVELAGAVDISQLPIPVTFSIKVEGLVITVTDRQITTIAAGRAKPNVTVKVEGVTIVNENLPTIDLPLEIVAEKEAPEPA